MEEVEGSLGDDDWNKSRLISLISEQEIDTTKTTIPNVPMYLYGENLDLNGYIVNITSLLLHPKPPKSTVNILYVRFFYMLIDIYF